MASEIRSIEEVIVAGLEQVKPALTGLQTLVFGRAESETYPTEKVDVDMFDGTRGAAKYTARGAKGQTIGLEGWTTEQYQPPLIDERIVITADDLKVRNFGEGNINNANSGEAKFQKRVNKQLQRKENGWQRAYNKQIVDLITTGKATVTEYDDKGNALAPRDIDFKMPASHIFTVTTAWSDVDADIFGDMEDADELIQKDSGLLPDVAIVGKNVVRYMLANNGLKSLMDNRRIELGGVVKEDRGNGLTYWGKIGNKEIYTFTDFDENGDQLVPADSYIPFSTQAETDIYYGSIDTMVNGEPRVVEAEQVMEERIDEDAVAKKWIFKSAKLYGLTQSAAFAHITTV
jgi:hypothetical protein